MTPDVDATDLAWLEEVLDTLRGGRPWPATPRGGPPLTVFPGRDRPLLLLPRLTRTALVRALAARPALQSRRHLVLRAAGAAARTGVARALGGDGTAGRPEVRPFDEVDRVLGTSTWPVVLLGKRDPNRKPVLQLVDAGGRTLGYLKVGWSPTTRALVDTEARTLQQLAATRAAAPAPAAPRLLLHHRSPELVLALTRPLPPGSRKWPNRRAAPQEATLAAATALAADGRLVDQPVATLGLWQRRLAELAPGDDVAASEVRDRLTAALSSLPPDLTVPVGGWHGDWAPWNLAERDHRVWAWDWEHADLDVPVGLDALHFRLSVLAEVDRLGLADALPPLAAEAPSILAPYGVPGAAAPAVHAAYLLERWLRERRLGGGDGPAARALHGGLLAALDTLSG